MLKDRRRVARKVQKAEKELARQIRKEYGVNKRKAREIAGNTLARNTY